MKPELARIALAGLTWRRFRALLEEETLVEEIAFKRAVVELLEAQDATWAKSIGPRS